MEIIFNRLDDNSCRFQIGPVPPSFANTLRRAMIGEVPTLAIENVRIYDNTSALFDEMLAHRLGLIPIKTDLTSYVKREECSCNGEGCPACTATFTMSVEGPGLVYSRDLIPQDPSTAPAYDTIPIVKLTKDQKVVVEAHAVLSTGSEHAKWQPVTACGYKNFPLITIGEACDGCGQCVDECPRIVLEVKGGHVEVIDGRIEECSLCGLCERACLGTGIGDEPAIKVSFEKERFIFVVEGDGSLKVKEIIEEGLKSIKVRSEDLMEKIDEISGGTGDEEQD
jgi:DNA-directed RNA polymerase subunit D